MRKAAATTYLAVAAVVTLGFTWVGRGSRTPSAIWWVAILLVVVSGFLLTVFTSGGRRDRVSRQVASDETPRWQRTAGRVGWHWYGLGLTVVLLLGSALLGVVFE